MWAFAVIVPFVYFNYACFFFIGRTSRSRCCHRRDERCVCLRFPIVGDTFQFSTSSHYYWRGRRTRCIIVLCCAVLCVCVLEKTNVATNCLAVGGDVRVLRCDSPNAFFSHANCACFIEQRRSRKTSVFFTLQTHTIWNRANVFVFLCVTRACF